MDGPRLHVEPARREHADLVHRLTQAAFAEYRGTLDPPSGAETETTEVVAADVDAGGAAIAWSGEHPVGAVRFAPQPGHLYVGRLAVLPSHRRHGVGAALVAFAESWATSMGLPESRVEVRSALPGNVAFFRRLGYAVVETRPHHRSPGATTVVLAKALDADDRGVPRSSLRAFGAAGPGPVRSSSA